MREDSTLLLSLDDVRLLEPKPRPAITPLPGRLDDRIRLTGFYWPRAQATSKVRDISAAAEVLTNMSSAPFMVRKNAEDCWLSYRDT